MLSIRRRVVAYVTRGKRLLVFAHPHQPEAGIQVPGGGVDVDEEVSAAALRGAREESGLEDLELRGYLGTCDYGLIGRGPSWLERRYYYHVESRGEVPESWTQCVSRPVDGLSNPAEMRFFWAPLPDCGTDLSAGLGDFVPLLEM